jgi:hypothetical protein
MTPLRIQELERQGFEWDCSGFAWECRLRELADYRKIHGHCNVPKNYSENSKLGSWVANQRRQYRSHRDGKPSPMTTFRIQELERLGFEWDCYGTAWEDHFSELANYRKIYGHCNVPQNYSENTKLANWVTTQRRQYKLHLKGKKTFMTLSRIQALESLGFEWKPSTGPRKGTPKKRSLDDDGTRGRERAVEVPEHMQQHSLKKTSAVKEFAAIKSTSLSNPNNATELAKSTSTSPRVEPQNIQRVEAGEPRSDETDLDDSPSDLAAKPSLYSDRQAAKSLSPDNSAPAGDSVESQANVSGLVQQKKSINSFSHALLDAGSPKNGFLEAAMKPANSRQGAESQLETAPSNGKPSGSRAAAVEAQCFTHALSLGDESTGNGVQATPDKSANAPRDTQQTPQDEIIQSDNVLNEVELELNWLGEDSMYCLSCPEFQFDFIYEYASPPLKVELRKLSRDDQSETEKPKQIVRMEDWLVSQRFDFVRKGIRKMLVRGFRRPRMGIVIAELRLLRRQQSERHFPAMILGRTETEPVKASAVIEQIDVNTLKVVATFPSESEAERQTGISRTNIRRGMREGRPAVCTVAKLLIILKAESLFSQTVFL